AEATTGATTLALHDALPSATSTLTGASVALTTGAGSIGTGTGANAINLAAGQTGVTATTQGGNVWLTDAGALTLGALSTNGGNLDRKSTRLNSSHTCISYGV